MAAFIGAAAVVGGALIGAVGSNKAAKTAAKGADAAAQTQWDMYNRTRMDQEPWRKAGESALSRLEQLANVTMDPYYRSPGKDYRMAEALGSVGNSPVARTLAPNQVGGLMNLISREGDMEYMNDMARLQQLAGLGPSVNQQAAQMGQGVANNVSGYQQNAAMAQGVGQAGQYNAYGQGLKQLAPLAQQAYNNWSMGGTSTMDGQQGYGDTSQWYGYGGAQ